MSPNLKQLLDNNELSEIEVVEFLCTLQKLSKNEVIDPRNFELLISHFGFKQKEGWIDFCNGSKYKF